MTVVFDYLVFNVQFVFAVSQQLIYYIIHFVVCQVFFLSFFKNFFYLTENLFWRFSFSNFCIISYRLTFVKNFFNFFEILFPQVVRFWPSATFISYHRFKCLSRTFLSFFEKLFELHFSETQFFFVSNFYILP